MLDEREKQEQEEEEETAMAAVAAPQEKKIGRTMFEIMGKTIATRWRDLSGEGHKKYAQLAEDDTVRYKDEMIVYNDKQANRLRVAMKDETAVSAAPTRSKEEQDDNEITPTIETPPNIVINGAGSDAAGATASAYYSFLSSTGNLGMGSTFAPQQLSSHMSLGAYGNIRSPQHQQQEHHQQQQQLLQAQLTVAQLHAGSGADFGGRGTSGLQQHQQQPQPPPPQRHQQQQHQRLLQAQLAAAQVYAGSDADFGGRGTSGLQQHQQQPQPPPPQRHQQQQHQRLLQAQLAAAQVYAGSGADFGGRGTSGLQQHQQQLQPPPPQRHQQQQHQRLLQAQLAAAQVYAGSGADFGGRGTSSLQQQLLAQEIASQQSSRTLHDHLVDTHMAQLQGGQLRQASMFGQSMQSSFSGAGPQTGLYSNNTLLNAIYGNIYGNTAGQSNPPNLLALQQHVMYGNTARQSSAPSVLALQQQQHVLQQLYDFQQQQQQQSQSDIDS